MFDFRGLIMGSLKSPCTTSYKYQFVRDLIACRDWYNRDSRSILSRNEICDVF